LVINEKYKQLNDLVLLGFENLSPIIESKFGNIQKMKESGLITQAEQVYVTLPETLAKINEIKTNIEKNDLESLKKNLDDKKWLACFRDEQGKTSIHLSIEHGHFGNAAWIFNGRNRVCKFQLSEVCFFLADPGNQFFSRQLQNF